MASPIIQQKACVECGSTENGFYKDRKTKDGLFSKCRKCVNAHNRDWKQKHPDSVKRTRAKRPKRPPKPPPPGYYQSEGYKEYKRGYYQRNKTTFDKRSREWTENNRERSREIARTSNARPIAKLHKRLRQAERHRQIKLRSDGSVTPTAVLELLRQQNYLCGLCAVDISESFTIDHVIPVTRDGLHTMANIQLLCRECNARTGNRLPPADG